MPTINSSWIVAAVTIPAQTITVNGFAVVVPAGTYYLRHTTAALSLIDVLDAAINAAVPRAGSTTFIAANRRTRLTFGATMPVTWGTATLLRDLLGFDGDLAFADDYSSASFSELLWSPGFPATPKMPGLGWQHDHQMILVAPDGSRIRRVHLGSEQQQELHWDHIVPSRLVTTNADARGTFDHIYTRALRFGYHFFHYEQMPEDVGSSAAVTWTTARGPYVLRAGNSGNWYRRNVHNADISSPLELKLQVVSEYT